MIYRATKTDNPDNAGSDFDNLEDASKLAHKDNGFVFRESKSAFYYERTQTPNWVMVRAFNKDNY